MTKEKEAILTLDTLALNGLSIVITEDMQKDFKTVLNLIQKQQKEIENKDKIINEMAKHIAVLDTDEDICKNVTNIGKSFCPEDDCDNLNREVDCDVCIRKYFERKVEE